MEKNAQPARLRLRRLLYGLLIALLVALQAAPARAYPAADIALVKEIIAGTTSSSLAFGAQIGSRVYFVTDDGVHGREPWVTDGTPDGTFMLRDINSTAGSSSLPYALQCQPAGDLLYFVADDGTHGSELWVTDGTPAGTQLVKDLRPGLDSTNITFAGTVGQKLYFFWSDASGSNILSISDGSEAGTLDIQNFGTTAKLRITKTTTLVFGGKLYQTVSRSVSSQSYFPLQTELWVFGTTPGSGQKLATASDPLYTFYMDNLIAGTSRVFFMSYSGDSTDYYGREYSLINMYSTDGTPGGTKMLKSTFMQYVKANSSNPTFIQPGVLGDRIFYTRARGELHYYNSGIQELWVSDGVSGVTQRLLDLPHGLPEAANFSELVSFYIPVNGKMFFLFRAAGNVGSSTNPVFMESLWRSDGTGTGTLKISELSSSPYESYIAGLTAAGSLLYYSPHTDDGTTMRCALERTDGTLAGTIRLHEAGIPTAGSYCSGPFIISKARSGANILFVSDNPFGNIKLYSSDGTVSGTRVVKELCTVPNSLSFTWVQAKDYFGGVYFIMGCNAQPYQFWRTDGTTAGTEQVPTADSLTTTSFFGSTGRRLLLIRDDTGLPDAQYGAELWGLSYQLDHSLYAPSISR